MSQLRKKTKGLMFAISSLILVSAGSTAFAAGDPRQDMIYFDLGPSASPSGSPSTSQSPDGGSNCTGQSSFTLPNMAQWDPISLVSKTQETLMSNSNGELVGFGADKYFYENQTGVSFDWTADDCDIYGGNLAVYTMNVDSADEVPYVALPTNGLIDLNNNTYFGGGLSFLLENNWVAKHAGESMLTQGGYLSPGTKTTTVRPWVDVYQKPDNPEPLGSRVTFDLVLYVNN